MGTFISWGPPGTGKTTFAASFAKYGYRVHFLDLDNKIRKMENLKPLIEKGSITIQTINAPLEQTKLKMVALRGLKTKAAILPSGYIKITEAIDDWFENPPEDHENTVIVVDPMSKFNSHLLHLMRFHQGGKLEFSGWDAVLSNYQIFFDTFFNYREELYAHRILTCHSRDDKDDALGIIQSRLLLDGQYRDRAGGDVEEVYYHYVDAPAKMAKAKFKILTKPSGWVLCARTSRGLQTSEDITGEDGLCNLDMLKLKET